MIIEEVQGNEFHNTAITIPSQFFKYMIFLLVLEDLKQPVEV